MKTIAEFAIERGVSEKTVRRRLAEVGQQKDKVSDKSDKLSDTELTRKIKNTTYITAKGEEILSSLLPSVKNVSDNDGQNKDKVSDKSDKLSDNDGQPKNTENEEILFLREQVKNLQEELKAEREHSRAMSEHSAQINERFAQITENQQKLLGIEQVKTAPAALMGDSHNDTKEKKRGFFSFFTRK